MLGHIFWIEGNLGVGKTTLAAQLAALFGYRLFLEPVETNPYLGRFYKDPKRWSFPMQIHLLMRRFAIQQAASYVSLVDSTGGAILDRGIAGDRVFCKLHYEAGNMSRLEWETYEYAYNVMAASLRVPSVILYLDADPEVVLRRKQTRGRPEEAGVPLEYLEKLDAGYGDLLEEIESGRHAWAQGMQVMRWDWNEDHQSIEPLVQELCHRFGMSVRPEAGGDRSSVSAG